MSRQNVKGGKVVFREFITELDGNRFPRPLRGKEAYEQGADVVLCPMARRRGSTQEYDGRRERNVCKAAVLRHGLLLHAAVQHATRGWRPLEPSSIQGR